MTNFDFTPFQLPPETQALRSEVRRFLDDALQDLSIVDKAHTWTGYDADFSKKLADHGWIGMTWPSAYGGHERSPIERYVVIEELLAAGAPVAAHWIADRQSGPQILRFGSEEARRHYVPAIARGEMFFCIGMSEPNSGSDLASIKTSARRTDGGWLVSGAKLWTTIVQHAQAMIALVRTSKSDGNRHGGLSQFIIDLDSPGVTKRGITDHNGEVHFGEVFLDNVFVPDDRLLGSEGDGWAQVNAELALERSGPERYLSSYQLLESYFRHVQASPSDVDLDIIGESAAEMWTLRQMSLSVVGKLAADLPANLEAAIVKDLGACFEQGLPHRIQSSIDCEQRSGADQELVSVMNYLLKASPSFSLRGGTREILRGIISRGIGLR